MANKWDLSEAGKAWQKEYQQGYRNKISTINYKRANSKREPKR